MTPIYGFHLTLRVADIENCSALEGFENISSLLYELVSRIGMRILAGPLVGEEVAEPINCGWSGVVILAESHAAIHTYPARREAFVDVFSCKVFDEETVFQCLRERLRNFSVREQNTSARGIHWGTDIGAEMDTWMHTRDISRKLGQ